MQYSMAVFERKPNPSVSLMWYYLCRYQATLLPPIRQEKLPGEIETLEKQLMQSEIQSAQQNAAAIHYVQQNANFLNPVPQDYGLPVYQIEFETAKRPLNP